MRQLGGRRPVIGIVADVKQIGPHPFHAVGEKYINAVAHGAGAVPILLPALTAAGEDLEPISAPLDLLDLVDGLFLPGSVSNVEPRRDAPPSRCPCRTTRSAMPPPCR